MRVHAHAVIALDHIGLFEFRRAVAERETEVYRIERGWPERGTGHTRFQPAGPGLRLIRNAVEPESNIVYCSIQRRSHFEKLTHGRQRQAVHVEFDGCLWRLADALQVHREVRTALEEIGVEHDGKELLLQFGAVDAQQADMDFRRERQVGQLEVAVVIACRGRNVV